MSFFFDFVDKFYILFNFFYDHRRWQSYPIHFADIFSHHPRPILINPALAHNLIEFNLNPLNLFVTLNLHLLCQLTLVTILQLEKLSPLFLLYFYEFLQLPTKVLQLFSERCSIILDRFWILIYFFFVKNDLIYLCL
jgi:hypothetical protein